MGPRQAMQFVVNTDVRDTLPECDDSTVLEERKDRSVHRGQFTHADVELDPPALGPVGLDRPNRARWDR